MRGGPPAFPTGSRAGRVFHFTRQRSMVRATACCPTSRDPGKGPRAQQRRRVGAAVASWRVRDAFGVHACRPRKPKPQALHQTQGGSQHDPRKRQGSPEDPSQLGADAPPRNPMATTRPHHAPLPRSALRRSYPRQEPSAVVPHAGICAVPTAMPPGAQRARRPGTTGCGAACRNLRTSRHDETNSGTRAGGSAHVDRRAGGLREQ